MLGGWQDPTPSEEELTDDLPDADPLKPHAELIREKLGARGVLLMVQADNKSAISSTDGTDEFYEELPVLLLDLLKTIAQADIRAAYPMRRKVEELAEMLGVIKD